ncbi:hypothetical protein [Methylobacterium oryzihabitans]|uniref:Uncharacterized protein n=1 Tax=Methylobacterium oryzihabitans TaxID=2499852 RepID=A0A3S2V6U0_9HYPH|nr:hypothetical protein [Methylobacterium oryzihabitans]RVU15222.1 hypothetical protein EOE48_20665 [Methylobacterium oryzihabitans]
MSEFSPEISEKPPEISEKPSEARRMTTRAEAALLIRTLAEPRPVGDSVKAAINRAAARVSQFLQEPMRYGRAEDIWRREARRISAAEMDALRAATGERPLAEQGCALAEVADSLERLAAGLAAGEARVDPDQLRRAAREARQSARALGRLADARAEV